MLNTSRARLNVRVRSLYEFMDEIYLATIHYEIQHKKNLSHGMEPRRNHAPRDIKEYKRERAYMD